MSARKLPLRFASEAREDVQDLLIYTQEQWGIHQRRVYREALNEAFRSLRANPYLGKARPDLDASVRSLVVEQHLILYRVEDDAVRVLRVVHQRRDITRQVLP
jgi:toxin ParE1/3/4